MREVSQALKALFFLAKPYHSWERKLNEPTNGWIRPYLPKKTSFEGVSLKTLRAIADWLNNQPRNGLRFQTPKEFFFASQSYPLWGVLGC